MLQQTPENSASLLSNGKGFESLQDSESNRKLLQYLDECFTSCKKYRLQFEQQWFLNLSFYFGKQYVQWMTYRAVPGAGVISTNRLVEPPAPPWRVRLIINRTRQIIRREMAKVTKEQPTGFVIPKSSDQEDQLAAKAGDSLVEYFWREKKYMRELRRAVFWSSICGTGFIKDWYDPDIAVEGDIKGDLFVKMISPFHIYVPDVQEEEIEDQAFVIQQAAIHPDRVETLYGKRAKVDTTSSATILEDKYLRVMGIGESNNKNLVLVKEIWIKPCAKFPDGAVYVWAGNTILKEIKGWPYRHKQFPFTKIDHIPTGRFYADSTITDIIPLQKEYNRGRSQISESKNRMSKPQMVAPKGSINPNRVTSEPGLIIEYTPGLQKPEVVTPPNLPSYLFEELNRSIQDMDDIAAQHQIPAGVHAATAISYLQEQDDTVYSYTIASIEEGTEKVSRHFLSHVTQFWDQMRQVQVVGYNDQFEVLELNKDSLHNNTNFTIQVGSATPRSIAAKQAFIMELGKMGWIPPEKALRYLDMAETSRMYEEMQVDTRQAQRENLLFQLNADQPVNTWDSHAAHLIEHDNFRKGQIFQSLPDEVKAMLEMHVQHHKMFIMIQKGLPLEEVMTLFAPENLQNPIIALQIEALLYTPVQAMVPQGQGQPQQGHSQPQGDSQGAVVPG